ncbi:toxin-antitoxin system YwqK family antitoxin [Parapedobacter sp. DT-150]|uniref:toxin-antitoxin system YwqK family antitoxin n=1 Tax=Parapedobacter sp. DT-150 TaxID=3396162 RepID=UPI003F1C5DF6
MKNKYLIDLFQIIVFAFIHLVANAQEGNIKRYYYNSGQLLAEGPMINLKREGEWKEYHKNGNLNAVGKFKSDKKHGKWRFFNESGVYIGTNTFAHGELIPSDNDIGKFEIEGISNIFFQKEGEYDQASFSVALLRYTFGTPTFRGYIGGGASWIDLPYYQVAYKDKSVLTDIPNEYPRDSTIVSMGTISNLSATAGFQGEIPLDWTNRPYNGFNVVWDAGVNMGFFNNSSEKGSDNFVQRTFDDFVAEPMFSVKGTIGLEMYLSDEFGIGLIGGLNYLLIKKEVNSSYYTDEAGSFSFNAKPISTKTLLPFVGLKLIFRD